jgi:hypothetical protein
MQSFVAIVRFLPYASSLFSRPFPRAAHNKAAYLFYFWDADGESRNEKVKRATDKVMKRAGSAAEDFDESPTDGELDGLVGKGVTYHRIIRLTSSRSQPTKKQ